MACESCKHWHARACPAALVGNRGTGICSVQRAFRFVTDNCFGDVRPFHFHMFRYGQGLLVSGMPNSFSQPRQEFIRPPAGGPASCSTVPPHVSCAPLCFSRCARMQAAQQVPGRAPPELFTRAREGAGTWEGACAWQAGAWGAGQEDAHAWGGAGTGSACWGVHMLIVGWCACATRCGTGCMCVCGGVHVLVVLFVGGRAWVQALPPWVWRGTAGEALITEQLLVEMGHCAQRRSRHLLNINRPEAQQEQRAWPDGIFGKPSGSLFLVNPLLLLRGSMCWSGNPACKAWCTLSAICRHCVGRGIAVIVRAPLAALQTHCSASAWRQLHAGCWRAWGLHGQDEVLWGLCAQLCGQLPRSYSHIFWHALAVSCQPCPTPTQCGDVLFNYSGSMPTRRLNLANTWLAFVHLFACL